MATANPTKEALTYRGKPLIRAKNTLYYGSMAQPYIIMLQIVSTKEFHGLPVADRVMVSLMKTDESLNPLQRIVKSAEKNGLYEAMDIASVWLERALAAK